MEACFSTVMQFLIPCVARSVERVMPTIELLITRTGVWRMVIPVTLSIVEDCSRFGSRIGFWKWEDFEVR